MKVINKTIDVTLPILPKKKYEKNNKKNHEKVLNKNDDKFENMFSCSSTDTLFTLLGNCEGSNHAWDNLSKVKSRQSTILKYKIYWKWLNMFLFFFKYWNAKCGSSKSQISSNWCDSKNLA